MSINVLPGSVNSSVAASAAKVVPKLNSDLTAYTRASTDAYHTVVRGHGPIAYWNLEAGAAETAFVDSMGGRQATIANLGTGVLTEQTTLIPSVGRASAKFVAASTGSAAVNSAQGADLNALFNGSTPFSFGCVVSPNITRSGASAKYSMLSNVSSFIGVDFRIGWNSASQMVSPDIDLAATQGSNECRVTCPAVDLANNVPTPLLVTYDGSRSANGLKVYVGGQVCVNNIIANTLTNNIAPATFTTIGANGAGSGTPQNFNGNLSDIAIYDYVLTPAQVAAQAVAFAADPALPDLPGPVNCILDNDWGSDVDGMVALYMAIAAHKAGKINILGIGCASLTETYEAPMVRAVLNYYGLNAIPVATNSNGSADASSYNHLVYTRFGAIPNDVPGNYPTTNTLYRTILAAQPNASTATSKGVVFANMGIPYNLVSLLQSTADGISTLTGVQICQKKLLREYAMIAEYPNGGSSNGTSVPATTINWLNLFPTNVPRVIDSHIAGFTVLCGFTPSQNVNPLTNPLMYALNLYGAANPGLVVNGQRSAYDGLTMLAVIYGTGASQPNGPYFAHPFKGKASVTASTAGSVLAGSFYYTPTLQNWNHRASIKAANDNTLAAIINAMIATVA